MSTPAQLSIPANLDPSDTFVIKGGGGFAVMHVRRQTGETFSIRVRSDGAAMTQFNTAQLPVDERRDLEKRLYQQGVSQADIADIIGVSQATVSLDLKKLG